MTSEIQQTNTHQVDPEDHEILFEAFWKANRIKHLVTLSHQTLIDFSLTTENEFLDFHSRLIYLIEDIRDKADELEDYLDGGWRDDPKFKQSESTSEKPTTDHESTGEKWITREAFEQVKSELKALSERFEAREAQAAYEHHDHA